MRLLLKIKILRWICFLGLIFFISCKKEIKKESNKIEETSRVDHLPYYNEESFTPHWITPNSNEEKQFHKIPDFKLVNQLGETVTQKTFDNKIYITDFFFASCPGICPQMTSSMYKLQRRIYKRF